MGIISVSVSFSKKKKKENFLQFNFRQFNLSLTVFQKAHLRQVINFLSAGRTEGTGFP